MVTFFFDMDIPAIITKEFQQLLTPKDVLQILRDGNKRFKSDAHSTRDYAKQRQYLTDAQYPVAVILGCIDSRVPSELIFDVGLGVLFNVRVAGNILNNDILGSIEFACKISGAKLIVVMGHADCGAIKGALNGVRLSHVTSIMEKIDPVIESVRPKFTDHTSEEFMNAVIDANASFVSKQILQQSDVIKDMVEDGEVKIVTALYKLKSGEVKFTESK